MNTAMYGKVKKIMLVVSLLYIVCSIITLVYMNIMNRSLWVDEAMLAENVCRRSLMKLTASRLDWNQSAPVLYLHLVKLLTLVFGNSEIVLRLLSFISYILSLSLLYFLLLKAVRTEWALIGVAVLSGMQRYLYYANEFKQYMTEAVCVLAVLWLYYLYSEEKMKWYTLIVGTAILIWCANPVCFVIGGILIYEFIDAIVTKKWKDIYRIVVGGVAVLCSFAVYYFYALRSVIASGDMTNYWAEDMFVLIPHSMGQAGESFLRYWDFAAGYGKYYWTVAFFAFISCFLNLFFERNKYIFVISLTIFVSLVASSLGFYPAEGRLFLFINPLLMIQMMFSLKVISKERKIPVVLSGIFLLFLMFKQDGIRDYLNDGKIYREDEETRDLVAYLQDGIKEDEIVYVYHASIPAFEYYNGYDNHSIGQYKNNVIFANGFFMNGENSADIELVSNSKKAYIFTSHVFPERIAGLLDALEMKGSLNIAAETYGTKLYYYNIDQQWQSGRVQE